MTSISVKLNEARADKMFLHISTGRFELFHKPPYYKNDIMLLFCSKLCIIHTQ